MKNPLIIIGMHRSGTSLVAKVLEKAGIFMGVFKDHNYEAMHFLSLNQQTLWAAKGDWLNPKVPEPQHYQYIPARQLYHEHFRATLRLAKLDLTLRQPRWGWKDPRNTFTLPMWLQLFPKAFVLHVYRDIDEVAHSLKKRNKKLGEVYDYRLDDLDFNRELARMYQVQARSYKEELGFRYHAVNYADIMAGNDEVIKELEIFCGKPLREIFREYCSPQS